MSSEKLRIHTAMPPEPAESETTTHARRRIFAQDKAMNQRSRARKDGADSARRVHMQRDEADSDQRVHAQKDEANSARRVYTQKDEPDSVQRVRAQKDEASSARRVHMQKDKADSMRRVRAQKDEQDSARPIHEQKGTADFTPRVRMKKDGPDSARPIHWKCLPHPLQRRGLRRPGSPRPKLSAGDRMLRNTAVACALLLGVLALGNIRQPWAIRASETVQRALTMHIDLDSSIGRLSFVRDWMPESALVFFNLDGGAELAAPVSGELKHAYSDDQPWLLFACPEDSPVCAAADGTVTAVSELSGGSTGVLVDHGEGMETVYAYLSSASVQPGDAVSRGQALGQSAAQLYFELRQSEAAVDPTERMGLQ